MTLPLSSPQKPTTSIKKVAMLFSGGPAPAANAVIGSAAACFARAGIKVYGMLNGYSHLVGYKTGTELTENTHYLRLDRQIPEGLRTSPGICIGTARANPGKGLKKSTDFTDAEKTAPLRAVYDALCSLDVDVLISIGGDDTLTTAAKFKLFMNQLPADQKRIRVIHLPKTIDNDYKGIDFTFGYFTAVELLSHELRNLLADSEATHTAYFCQLMGRAAGWLAYGAAIAGEASLVVGLEDIPQEWLFHEETRDPETMHVLHHPNGKPVMRTVLDADKLVDHIVDVILSRETEGKKSFVCAISEGVAEYLALADIRMCLSDDEYRSLKPDTFGHFPVSLLKFSSWLGRLVSAEYKKRTGKSKKSVGLQFGYEIRCKAPTAVDVMLGSQIGVGAYRALCEKDLNGVMISVGGTMELSFPTFEELIDMEILRAYSRPITVGSDIHQLARYLEARVNVTPVS